MTNEQVCAHPLPSRHNIITIVMHCLQNLSHYGLACHGGPVVIEHDERFNVWSKSPEELIPLQTDLPSVADMLDTLGDIRASVFALLAMTPPDALARPHGGVQWYAEFDTVRADAYLRTIMHAMAHTRQVWMLRGVMGLTDSDGWPVQHWA